MSYREYYLKIKIGQTVAKINLNDKSEFLINKVFETRIYLQLI